MFEGIKVKGVPRQVLVGGKLVVDKGSFLGKPGSGRFLKRNTYAGV